MKTINLVTTFNKSGYEKYGKRMIESFSKNLPPKVNLICLTEETEMTVVPSNIMIVDLHSASPQLVKLKTKWKNDPRANGFKSNTPSPGQKPDFKWDAVRFSHKVFAIEAASRLFKQDYLIWVDADTYCFDGLDLSFLLSVCPGDMQVASYLGRPDHYTECGWVAYNMNYHGLQFIKDFANWYITEKIFDFDEWHDSWIFDRLREVYERNGLQFYNLSPTAGRGEHAFINSALGSKLDHMKGPRKELGKSKPSDLKIKRTESYWKF